MSIKHNFKHNIWDCVYFIVIYQNFFPSSSHPLKIYTLLCISYWGSTSIWSQETSASRRMLCGSKAALSIILCLDSSAESPTIVKSPALPRTWAERYGPLFSPTSLQRLQRIPLWVWLLVLHSIGSLMMSLRITKRVSRKAVSRNCQDASPHFEKMCGHTSSCTLEKPCVRDPRSPSAVDPRKQV